LLDGAAAFAEARQNGHEYIFVADTGGDYYVEPRETH
jgi:hypothetical protein